MPYAGEVASKNSQASTARDELVIGALGEYAISGTASLDIKDIRALCIPLGDLPTSVARDEVIRCISIDGSRQETPIMHDSLQRATLCYVRVGTVTMDLAAIRRLAAQEHISLAAERATRHETVLNYVLPGVGLALGGMDPLDSWRAATDRLLERCTFTDEVLGGDGARSLSLADALLMLNGRPGHPADSLRVRKCPVCVSELEGVRVRRDGGACNECGAALYLVDALGLDEMFVQNGRENALNSIMNTLERLALVATIELMRQTDLALLGNTLVVADGPLAAIGAIQRLARPIHGYLDAVATEVQHAGHPPMLVVGVEKGGNFASHGHLVAETIPRGHVMSLTTEYIARNITGRPGGRDYGANHMYGRRFFYRRRDGAVLTITVPAAVGISPYGRVNGGANEEWASYPSLRTVLETLETLTDTSLPGAVLPLTLAHHVSSIGLSATTVLQILGQQHLGLARNTRLKTQPFT